MSVIFALALSDDELRQRLQAGETISFIGEAASLHQIERQVERLGFGDVYTVTSTQGSHEPKVTVKPLSA
jgi:hypothetical protein